MARTLILLSLFSVVASPHIALAWTLETGTVALPAPEPADVVTGARVTCVDGRMSLHFEGVAPGDGKLGTAPVALQFDTDLLAVSATGTSGVTDFPPAAIRLAGTASAMKAAFSAGDRDIQASFPLNGAGEALAALLANCSSPDDLQTHSGNGASMEVAARYRSGIAVEVPFQAPEGSNSYWIGFAKAGGGPTDYISGGYAYVSAGNPAVVTAPALPGNYELRFADDTTKTTLLSVPVTIGEPVTATISAPRQAIGGVPVAVSHESEGGPFNYIAIIEASEPDNVYHNGQWSYVNTNPTLVRTPAVPGEYEVRYVLGVGGGKVVARQPISVSAPPALSLPPAEAAAGADFQVELTDAPRVVGDYLYIAAPGSSDNDYSGGYVPIPNEGPVTAKAPAVAGEWEMRYVVPSTGGYVALGRARLTVR